MLRSVLCAAVAAASCWAASAAAAQEELVLSSHCVYAGDTLQGPVYGFASDREARDALDRVMRYTGLSPNFVIRAADVPNAVAAIRGSERLILYNQDFMLRVRDLTRTEWSAISILAHEVGHHLQGHTLLPGGSRPLLELEADRFSGYVLHRMGATLDEARAAMDRLGSDQGSATHPARTARLAAITNGWIQARDQSGGSGARPGGETVPATAVPILDLSLRGGGPFPPGDSSICRFAYAAEGYRIRTRGEASCVAWNFDLEGDIRVETSLRVLTGPTPAPVASGLGFGRRGDGSYFLFKVNDQGEFALGHYDAGSGVWSWPVGWTATTSLRRGWADENRIAVELRGREVRLFANGEQVGTHRVDRPTAGQLMLYVNGGYPDDATEVSFGHLRADRLR